MEWQGLIKLRNFIVWIFLKFGSLVHSFTVFNQVPYVFYYITSLSASSFPVYDALSFPTFYVLCHK